MKTIYSERKSPRAKWHDYNGGEYFVTICTKNKFHYFGKIKNNEIVLTDIGFYLKSQIDNIKNHYPFVDILLYTIMPNHIHLIIAIDNNRTRCRDKTDGADDNKNEHMKNISNKQGWLSVCVGSIKSAVTKYANENMIPFAWQGRFHDHIIRNRNEMNRIAEYIKNNPIKWGTKPLYGRGLPRPPES